jgi:DnaJ-domain-containing protein 1
MTGKLQEMLERIEQLPQPEQDELADRIEAMLAALEEQAWQEAFADPASDRFFTAAEAEIEQARQEGSLTPLFPTIEDRE